MENLEEQPWGTKGFIASQAHPLPQTGSSPHPFGQIITHPLKEKKPQKRISLNPPTHAPPCVSNLVGSCSSTLHASLGDMESWWHWVAWNCHLVFCSADYVNSALWKEDFISLPLSPHSSRLSWIVQPKGESEDKCLSLEERKRPGVYHLKRNKVVIVQLSLGDAEKMLIWPFGQS